MLARCLLAGCPTSTPVTQLFSCSKYSWLFVQCRHAAYRFFLLAINISRCDIRIAAEAQLLGNKQSLRGPSLSRQSVGDLYPLTGHQNPFSLVFGYYVIIVRYFKVNQGFDIKNRQLTE